MPLLQFALISGSLGNKIVKESQGKGCCELLALADYWQWLLQRRIPGQAWGVSLLLLYSLSSCCIDQWG